MRALFLATAIVMSACATPRWATRRAVLAVDALYAAAGAEVLRIDRERDAAMRECADVDDRERCMGGLARPIAPLAEDVEDATSHARKAIKRLSALVEQLQGVRR